LEKLGTEVLKGGNEIITELKKNLKHVKLALRNQDYNISKLVESIKE
jgi:hypothetical protein